MKRWIQTVTGLIMSAFLTLGLGGKARAEDAEEALSESAPTEIIEIPPVPAAEAPKPVEEPAAPAQSEAPKPAVPVQTEESKPAVPAQTEEAKPVAPVQTEAPAAAVSAGDETPAAQPESVSPAAAETAVASAPEVVSAPEAPAPIKDEPTAPASAGAEDTGVPSVMMDTAAAEPQTASAVTGEGADHVAGSPEAGDAAVPDAGITVEADGAQPEAEAADDAPSPAAEAETTLLPEVQPMLRAAAAPAPAETAAVDGTSEPDRETLDAPTVRSSAPGAARSASSVPVITVGDAEIDGSEDVENGDWRYLSDSGRLVLLSYDGADGSVVTGDGGATILTAGISRIGTLSCSGDVVILGTGILLVDDVQMAENSSLSLQTNTDIYEDGTGSAALFLKTGDNEYTLVNGELPGILDEEYTIEGVTLIVPPDSSLLLNGVGALIDPDTKEVVEYYFENEPVNPVTDYTLDESAPRLTVSTNAGLRIDSGAVVQMKSIKSRVIDAYIRPTLNVVGGGILSILGDVSGDGIITMNGSAGTLLGSGQIQGERINVDTAVLSGNEVVFEAENIHVSGGGSIDSLTVADSFVTLEDSVEIESFTGSGVTTVIFNEPGSIRNITVDGSLTLATDESLTYYSDSQANSVTGVIRGDGEVVFSSGIYTIGSSAIREGETVSAGGGAIVYDYSDQAVTSASTTPLRVRPDNAPAPGEDGLIPLAVSVVNEYMYSDDSRIVATMGVDQIIDPAQSEVPAPSISTSGNIDLAALKAYAEQLRPTVTITNNNTLENAPYVVELLHRSSGNELSTSFYTPSKLTGTVPAADVVLVRLTLLVQWTNPNAGGTITTTNTSFTGTGVLGGSGAGSVGGGRSSVLFRGSANSHQTPDPVVPDPVVCNPVVPDPVPVDTPAAWRVIVSAGGRYYTVRVYNGAREVLNPGVKMTARMNFTLPDGWDAEAIFAVFRNADGSLTAFKAAYDPIAGTLTFHTDCTGTFALVSFPFEGTPYSDAFYEALAQLELIAALPVRR